MAQSARLSGRESGGPSSQKITGPGSVVGLTGEQREKWQAALAPDEPPAARAIAGAEWERWQAALRPTPAIRPAITEGERARWLAALSPAIRPALSDAVRQMWVDALADIGI